MGLPCKRGQGGKIEGCHPVDNDHKDHNDDTSLPVDNDPQRSSDKTIATVNILLTRFLFLTLENVDVRLHAAIFGVLYILFPRHPFDRLIIEFRRSKASLSSKKGRRKRSSLGNGIDHNDGNTVISQNYNTRKVYLESSYSKNQSSYIDKQSKVGEVFKNKNNDGAQIRRRRSFARHRNILRGRTGRGRGQQFRFMRVNTMRMTRMMMKMRRMTRMRIMRLT